MTNYQELSEKKTSAILKILRIWWTYRRQECIPVGCVPPAVVAVWGGLHQAPPWIRPSQDQAPPGEDTPPGPDPPRTRHPPVNRMTNRCKNITLPQTSFAGGKNTPSVVTLDQYPIEITLNYHGPNVAFPVNASNAKEWNTWHAGNLGTYPETTVQRRV